MIESKWFRVVWVTITLIGIFLVVKVIAAGIQQWKILDAILDYKLDCIYNHKERYVEFSDMEDIYDTMMRIWDWSDKRILDEKKYRLIRPYIKSGW